MELRFVVPGRPVAWARARSKAGQRYTAPEQRAYRRRMQLAARAAMPRGWEPDGRFVAEVIAYVDPAQRNDLDNVVKMVGDALNRVAWIDDRRVDAWAIVRRVVRDQPRLEVTVVPVEAGEPVEITIAVGVVPDSEKPRGAATPGAMTDPDEVDR